MQNSGYGSTKARGIPPDSAPYRLFGNLLLWPFSHYIHHALQHLIEHSDFQFIRMRDQMAYHFLSIIKIRESILKKTTVLQKVTEAFPYIDIDFYGKLNI